MITLSLGSEDEHVLPVGGVLDVDGSSLPRE